MRIVAPFIRTGLLVTALSLSGCAGGCIAVGGTDNYQAPTLGRQLQELKVAKDTGAITDAEYQDTKTKMLNGEYTRKKS